MTRFAADSPAVAHGMGLFETMLVHRGQVVQREEHFRRLFDSARSLRFPEPNEREFHAAIDKVATNIDEAALRCIYVQDSSRWRLVATIGSIPVTTLRRRKGARVITLDRDLTRALPEHKMTSYAPSMIGLRTAIDAGADEGLFVDRRARVLEGTTTNVFAIKDSTLITARTSILPGIVRAWVLANAARVGLDVIHRAPTIEELRGGSFLTSSLTLLAPIVKIDGIACERPSPAFAEIRRLYRAVLSGIP